LARDKERDKQQILKYRKIHDEEFYERTKNDVFKCSLCKRKKKAHLFKRRTGCKSGYSPHCRSCYRKQYTQGEDCSRKKSLRKLKQQKVDFLYTYLKENPCSCESCKDSWCILTAQFDHIDPSTKRRKIASMVGSSSSLESLKKEVDKCEVCCVNEHKSKTSIQQTWYSRRWYENLLKGKPLYTVEENQGFYKVINPKREVMFYTLLESGCVECEEHRPYCLELHHRNPNEKYKIVSDLIYGYQYTIEDLEEEIEKCDVLCGNCHQRHSILERKDSWKWLMMQRELEES
jgi:hypothetical protein